MSTRITRKQNRGFTLVELLVVMAISVILMYLVLSPVLKSFQLTRRAQAMVEAQDSARAGMEQISREIGEAMEVIDWTAEPIHLPVYNVPTSGDAPFVDYLKLPNAKIDFVLPKMTVHCNNPDPRHDVNGQSRDYERYQFINGQKYYYAYPPCPVCGSEDIEFRPKLPLEQDVTIVRYFLGLRYNNPLGTTPNFGWQSPWDDMTEVDQGNQVVLYRIEFDPTDTTIFGSKPIDAFNTLREVLRDPKFFYSDAPVPGEPGKQFWQVWAERAQILGLSRYEDLVQGIDTNDDGIWDAVEPSVTFKFAKVDNDTFSGSPSSQPIVFHSKYGYWTPNSVTGVTYPLGISVYRYAYNADGTVNAGNLISYTTDVDNLDLVIRKYVGGADQGIVFNISEYMRTGQITGSGGNSIEMAFSFDHSLMAGSPVLNLNRGAVNFALDPRDPNQPNVPVCLLDPAEINMRFLADRDVDRNAAIRYAYLPHFDPDNGLDYATVVPESDVIAGPNMTPGPGYGRLIRYERVPLALGDPGLNQYKIDYDTGMIYFSRIPSQDLPEIESIRANYKIQFNKPGDVVRGDYQTRAMVVIHLGIRMFDPESGQPHVVELNNTIKVRNALR